MKFTKKDKRTNLEKEIDSLLLEMEDKDPDTDEYRNNVKDLETLFKARSYEKQKSVSPDTIAIIAGNLVGILFVLNFERLNVITSKALSFVLKGRV